MPIREVGRSGKRKNPRGRRKKRKNARAGRLGPGLKHKLGASHTGAELSDKMYGAELSARVTGAEIPAMSPPGLEPKSSAPGTLTPRSVSSVPASMASS